MKQPMDFMALFPKFSYILEVVLAELAFLHAFPRKKPFPARLAAALVLSVGTGYFLFNLHGGGHLGRFLQLLVTLTVTIACMFLPFQGTWLAITSACTAGIALQHIGYHLSRILALLPFVGGWTVPLEFGTCLAVFLICFLIVHFSGLGTRICDMRVPWILYTSIGIVLLCIGVTRFVRIGGSTSPVITFCISFYAIVCCSLTLLIQLFMYDYFSLRNEKMMLERISAEEKRQYEANRENRELLNIKYHDLKHKLLTMEDRLPSAEIASMRALIDSYDSAYKTGLDALDVVLNEKNDRCRQRGIAFTCMGAGEALRFMDTMDLYSLFGNILDNAISAAEKLENPEERIISVVIEKRGEFASISAMNYFHGEDLHFRDGIPLTTQTEEAGYHGFGLKSVRRIAEKYQGGLTISVSDGLFRLSVYMMDPTDRPEAAPAAQARNENGQGT